MTLGGGFLAVHSTHQEPFRNTFHLGPSLERQLAFPERIIPAEYRVIIRRDHLSSASNGQAFENVVNWVKAQSQTVCLMTVSLNRGLRRVSFVERFRTAFGGYTMPSGEAFSLRACCEGFLLGL